MEFLEDPISEQSKQLGTKMPRYVVESTSFRQ